MPVKRLGRVRLLILGGGSVLAFLFAVNLLGGATAAAAPALERLLSRAVVGDSAALGLGWLAAYALGNRSVIAALGLSLFEADLLTVPELYLVIAGSRLGAAAIVVFVGALDHLRQERQSLRERARERAAAVFEAASELAADHDGELLTVSAFGDPARTVVDYAREEDVDLIVMGSHGRSLVSRVLVGAVAQQVVQRAPVPGTVVG